MRTRLIKILPLRAMSAAWLLVSLAAPQLQAAAVNAATDTKLFSQIMASE